MVLPFVSDSKLNSEDDIKLARALERERLLAIVVDRIRRSLDLETIFNTTVREVRQLLHVDRVVIYRFNPDWSGSFAAEAVSEGWEPLIERQKVDPSLQDDVSHCSAREMSSLPAADTYLQENQGGEYRTGRSHRVCCDILQEGFSDCYVKFLQQLQARAYAIAGVYCNCELWGLLAIYQNSGPRAWDEEEGTLLVQIADQLGIAVQQAQLLADRQQQAIELRSTLHELKQAQAALIHTEKMSALGQLVAGIAHELNNPASFVHGNLFHIGTYFRDLTGLIDLYRQYYPEPASAIQLAIDDIDLDFLLEDLPKILGSMQEGANRIRQLVLSLRTFSRLDEADVKAADLHEGIDSTLSLLQNRLAAKADRPALVLEKHYDPELPLVECHSSQLNQVFMNLLANAIDALEERLQGETDPDYVPTLEIHTERRGDRVAVRAIDNGPGISEAVRARLFEPFFTTKPVGKGTGLGLSISYQIVTEKHGGTLVCRDRPGGGTEFCMELPLKMAGGDREPPSVLPSQLPQSLSGQDDRTS